MTIRRAVAKGMTTAAFSLLGSLNLDLDLNEDSFGVAHVPLPLPRPEPSDHVVSSAHSRARTTNALPPIDTSLPFFFFPFPVQPEQKRNATYGFHRTVATEQIRERWRERKGELTGEWKRRHREAVKSMRRRGVGGMD